MSQIAEAYVRVRPNFDGFRTAALDEATQRLKGLQTSVTDTENAVKRAARQNIESAVAERDELGRLHGEYTTVARNAEKGGAVQVEANRLAAESARKLGIAYREANSGSTLLGKHASAAASETGRLERGALAGSGAVRGLGRSLAFASAGFLGAAGLTEAIRSSVSQASDLQAQVIRNDEVFGKSAGVVAAWSRTAVSSMGMTQAAALDASSTIGTLLINLGKTPAEAARMSTQMVRLADDMAAFKKVAPDVALSALEGALQGRTRSLKQFGIVIDNTTIKAEALRLGLLKGNVDMAAVADAQTKVAIAQEKLSIATAKHGATSVQAAAATLALHHAETSLEKATSGATGTLTAQQKALAIHGALLEQTKNMQGAFARSQGEAAIEGQKFHAALKQLEAEIGTALLPIFTKYTGELAKWMTKAAESKKLHDELRSAASVLKDVLSEAISVVRTGWKVFEAFTGAVGGTKNAIVILLSVLAVEKIRGVVTEVIQLGMKFGLIGTEATTAAGVTESSFLGMKVATIELGATIKGVLVTAGIGIVIVAVGLLTEYVLTHWDKVKGYTEDLGHALVGTFKATWTIIQGYFAFEAGVMTTLLTAPIRALLEGLSHLPFVGGKFKSALHELDKYTTGWVKDGVKTMQQGGDQMGGAWAGAFDNQVGQAMVYTLQQAQATFSQSTNLFSGGVAGATPVLGKNESASPQQAKIIGLASKVALAAVPYETGGGRAIGGLSALGKPTDCSGLVHNLLASAGVSVPLTSQTQWNGGTPVSGPLEPGDLLFYNNHLNEANGQPGHVTMYLGGGMMVEDPHTGGHVQIVGVRNDGYMGARRYLNVKTSTPNTNPPGAGTGTPPPVAAPVATPMLNLSSGLTTKAKVKGLTDSGVASLKQTFKDLASDAEGVAPASVRKALEEQISKLLDSIHKGLGPDATAKIRSEARDLRKEITADVRMDKGVEKTEQSLNEMKAKVLALPGPLRAQIMPLMQKVREELTKVTTPRELDKAKADYKRLGDALKAETARMRQLLQQHVREQLATWKQHLDALKAAATAAKMPFEAAFGDMVNTAMTIFDRETSKHIDAMRADLDLAVAGMDAALQSQLDAIDAATAVLTPAEQQLKDVEAAHKAAADRAQLAADRAQLATDQAGGADAATLVADQHSIDEDLYNQQVEALTAQAQLERDAKNKQAEIDKAAAQKAHDANTAARQKEYDAAAQNYQDLRDLQKSSFQTQLSDLEKSLEARKTTVGEANDDVLKIMQDFGLDPTWFQAGNDGGSALLAGLEAAFQKAAPTLEQYQKAVQAVTDLQNAKPASPTTAADKQAAILDELKKQTELAREAAAKERVTALQVSVTPGATTNVNQVARDALR